MREGSVPVIVNSIDDLPLVQPARRKNRKKPVSGVWDYNGTNVGRLMVNDGVHHAKELFAKDAEGTLCRLVQFTKEAMDFNTRGAKDEG
jgi:hypothetical protein